MWGVNRDMSHCQRRRCECGGVNVWSCECEVGGAVGVNREWSLSYHTAYMQASKHAHAHAHAHAGAVHRVCGISHVYS